MPSGEKAPRAAGDRAPAFTICREDEAVPPALAGAVAALGNFDGVHRGHRALIEAVEEEARGTGALSDDADAGSPSEPTIRVGESATKHRSVPRRPAVALTFEPHPRAFFAPNQPFFRLTVPAAKEIVFAQAGLDGLIVRRFDAGLAGTSAAGFVTGMLKDELRLSGVVIGHDFHFGRGREGTPAILADLCAKAGLACRIVPAVALQPGEPPISSSAIRAALAAGQVAQANALLGYRWFVLGEVRHGDKRGRTLGYPTANLALDACGLAHGIYAVRARLQDGTMREGVASYGRRPTFDDGAPLLEVNLFAFSGDLYGQEIAVELIGFIRGEERFAGAQALVARMHVDAAEAGALIAADRVPSMLG